MKLIKIPNKREHLLTPWLSFEEAAAYCGISRETFRRLQTEILPCPATGGNPSNRRYLAPVVDQWWQTIATLASKDSTPNNSQSNKGGPR
jgi:hypothetical protein